MASAPKKCGKCDKTVYAAEEVKCLDKVWHKGCLKCTSCGTTLNIKTVKGYEKMPYCNVHYPTPKSTAVADNPEMQRIRQLQDVQSNSKYQKDFNENKGKLAATVVGDTASTRSKEVKRKESATETPAAQESQPQPQETNKDNQESNTPEPTKDPVVDDSSSAAHGNEPTSTALPCAKPEVKQPNPTEDEVEAKPSSDTTQSTQVKGRALYSYEPAADDEIELNVDDVIVEIKEADEGWLAGQNLRTGKQGLFPSNYVEITQ